jgi:hypothetical protein
MRECRATPKTWAGKTSFVRPFRDRVRSISIRPKRPKPWVNKALLAMGEFVNVWFLEVDLRLSDARETLLLIPKLFHSLATLWIRNFEFDDFNQMVDLICSYPKTLDYFALLFCGWGLSATPLIDLPPPPSFKSLWLTDTCGGQNHVIDWLLRHEHAYQNIHSLAVRVTHPEEVMGVSRFLEVIGPTLHTISFYIPYDLQEFGERVVYIALACF